MNLRPYQQAASNAVLHEWRECTSTLVVCPTGTGKTVIAADVIRRVQPMKTILVAHRGELIWQAKSTIERCTNLTCAVEKAELSAEEGLFGNYDVVCAMVQTLNAKAGDRKRMGKFDPMQFGLLVIDEFHHSVASTYQNVIGYFKQNPDLRILGLTATPDRMDEEALGQVCDTVAFDYEILDAIHDGWLVPIEQQMVSIQGLDFSHIRTTAGDLNGADLAAVMEAEQNLQGVAGASIPIIGSKRTLVFCASVKQAEILSDIFNRYRAGSSAWVCGATNEDKRKEMLAQFSSGEIQIMVNCNCLSEGFDNPGVEVVIQAKPTKSRALYSQQIGRATRPLPGVVDPFDTSDDRKLAIRSSNKPTCLVVDFVGNSGRHKLMTTADILGGNVSDDALDRAVARAKKLGTKVNMAELAEDEQRRIQAELDDRRAREAARKAHLVANVRYTAKRVDPFDAFGLEPAKQRGWHDGKVLTEKQRAILLKQGLDPDSLPYAQGRQILLEIFRRWDDKLCSLKQAAVLKRYGYETKDMTREQASKTLDALAANGWRRPEGVLTT